MPIDFTSFTGKKKKYGADHHGNHLQMHKIKGDWEELTDLPRENHWASLIALHDEMAISVYREQKNGEQEENNVKAVYSVLLTKAGQCGLEG